jgi:hypothetical protein
MSTEQILTTIIGLVGFVLTLALTVAAVLLLRKPLAKALEYLFKDEMVAKYGSRVILIFLGLAGLTAAFGSFYPASHGAALFIGDEFQLGEFTRYMFTGLLDLLGSFAEVIRWALYIGALFFIGFAVRSWRGPEKK